MKITSFMHETETNSMEIFRNAKYIQCFIFVFHINGSSEVFVFFVNITYTELDSNYDPLSALCVACLSYIPALSTLIEAVAIS